MTDWSALQAPSLEDFEAMAQAAFAGLPEAFRALCGGVVIHVDDFPDDETLDEMECETPFDLLGLFRGIGLAQGESDDADGPVPQHGLALPPPDPRLLGRARGDPGHLVTHVLVHEIGHHFGLSDDDMEGIEAAAS